MHAYNCIALNCRKVQELTNLEVDGKKARGEEGANKRGVWSSRVIVQSTECKSNAHRCTFLYIFYSMGILSFSTKAMSIVPKMWNNCFGGVDGTCMSLVV